ncbi:MAG: polysaccharide biosynthesis tyrosine autokinase [Dysgonamonadaceae bacterium]|jgi:capsular exopolysaccharide synthesis family protein|nr:polysaccharide biosynthesis tyrosine autokinase [Dysgonamonadaceae bacterium]
MEANRRINNKKNKPKEIDFNWFFVTLLVHWKLFLLSIILFFGFAYTKMRYAVNVYNVSSTIIQKGKGAASSSDIGVYQSMGLIEVTNAAIDNEIRIIRSRNLIQSVVIEQQLFVKYIVKGRFKDTELFGYGNKYYNTSPVKVYLDSTVINSLNTAVSMKVSVNEDETINVSGYAGGMAIAGNFPSLPATIETRMGQILLMPDESSVLNKNLPLEIIIEPPLWATIRYMNLMDVQLVSKTTNVLTLSVNETHISRGIVFLDKVVEVYNRQSIEEKNEAITAAVKFIIEQLDDLEKKLVEAQDNEQYFMEVNDIADIETELKGFWQEYIEYNTKVLNSTTAITLLSYLEKATQDNEEGLILVPMGDFEELSSLVRKYNTAYTERERLKLYATDDVPIIQNINNRLATLRLQIVDNIKTEKEKLTIHKYTTEDVWEYYHKKLSQIPDRFRKLEDLSRPKVLALELVQSFTAKKQALELTMAVSASVAKVLESPLPGGLVSPNRTMTYVFYLAAGFLFPFLIIGIRNMFNFKVSNENELMRISDIPVIISLPYVKTKDPVIVTETATCPCIEHFRLLRTNLQFVMNGEMKSILVTSTISGEGKTFVSINLGMTFALKYKTLLVGLDVRRPKINTYFDLPRRNGVISYITGEEYDLNKLIHKNVNDTNLDVLVSGVIPPNPNELLADTRLDELFVELRKMYDYIIIDTSPVGSVSDAFLLNRISDISLFVVRSNITPKTALSLINNIYSNERLNKLHIVLNAFKKNYNNGYGYGYDYGYGYGQNKS